MDIYTAWNGQELLFAAPLDQLQRILNLKEEAIHRIRTSVNSCELHGNGKRIGPYDIKTITVRYWGEQWQLIGE